mgnify:CR=1 FL=1
MSKEKVYVRECSTRLMEICPTACDKYENIWAYDEQDGLWRKDSRMHLEQLIRKQILPSDKISSHLVHEILDDVKSLSFKYKEFPVAPPQRVSFADCVVDIESGDVLEYDPKLYITAKLPVSYDPNGQCPLIEKIFSQLLPEDRVIDLYEIAAYCMFRSYPYQKFFFLYGRGANGKGVFARVLEAILGKHNISHVSMKNFQNNRFSGAELYNKYANICTELDYSDLNHTDLIKQLTGGDSIHAEKKFHHPFNFVGLPGLLCID